ncbi:MAG: hypothetical protein ACKPCJ_09660, partial [Betaproteobacteria bacterium]
QAWAAQTSPQERAAMRQRQDQFFITLKQETVVSFGGPMSRTWGLLEQAPRLPAPVANSCLRLMFMCLLTLALLGPVVDLQQVFLGTGGSTRCGVS